MKNDHRANGKNEAFVNPHHLPEAVVAISDLSRGSVKFNPISAIKSFLSKVPELRDAIDNGGIPMFLPWKSHKAARADRKSTRLNSSHSTLSRMPSSA